MRTGLAITSLDDHDRNYDCTTACQPRQDAQAQHAEIDQAVCCIAIPTTDARCLTTPKPCNLPCTAATQNSQLWDSDRAVPQTWKLHSLQSTPLLEPVAEPPATSSARVPLYFCCCCALWHPAHSVCAEQHPADNTNSCTSTAWKALRKCCLGVACLWVLQFACLLCCCADC